jgi:hypothetical protein
MHSISQNQISNHLKVCSNLNVRLKSMIDATFCVMIAFLFLFSMIFVGLSTSVILAFTIIFSCFFAVRYFCKFFANVSVHQEYCVIYQDSKNTFITPIEKIKHFQTFKFYKFYISKFEFKLDGVNRKVLFFSVLSPEKRNAAFKSISSDFRAA